MERLSPAATRISLLAGEDNRPRPHIHGVESGGGPNFGHQVMMMQVHHQRKKKNWIPG
jgi:hypothetical protein